MIGKVFEFPREFMRYVDSYVLPVPKKNLETIPFNVKRMVVLVDV
jgi:hypothetical protein